MQKNKKSYRTLMYWGGAFLVLFIINMKLVAFNHIVTNGRTVLVPLYFAEKKDFSEDGYMNIRYENIIPDTNFNKHDGTIVISNDANKVAIYSRFFNNDTAVEIGEFLIQYQVKRPYGFFSNDGGTVKIAYGPEKFYFKEKGLHQHYMRARYAVLKVPENGDAILFGLADMNYQDLGRFF